MCTMNKPKIGHGSGSSQRYSSGSSPNSAPIPLPSTHLRRTTSEVDIEEAHKIAEWRETRMYHRLLTGMMKRSQEKGLDQNPKIIRSLENLMLTQASPIETSSKQNEEWDIIGIDEQQGMGRGQKSENLYSSSLSKKPSATSWNSAMSGGWSSSSLSRRPSRGHLSTLAPLKESLKSSFVAEQGIFDLEI